MICPLCKAKMKASVKLTGGCQGHSEDDYCYCDSPDVHVEFVCPNAAVWIRGKGEDLIKNRRRCRQAAIKVGDLGDQYALGQWLTDNYVPTVEDQSREGGSAYAIEQSNN